MPGSQTRYPERSALRALTLLILSDSTTVFNASFMLYYEANEKDNTYRRRDSRSLHTESGSGPDLNGAGIRGKVHRFPGRDREKAGGRRGAALFRHILGKLRRYFDPKNFSDPFRVIKGFGEALSILKKEKPDVVFSKGGFVSVPVVRAASVLKIPVVIHESDMTPGLANKLSYGAASKICCSFKETLKHLPAEKAVFTGSPIRSGILNGDRQKARFFTGIRQGDYTTILVIGGSLGAQHVNEEIRKLLPALSDEYNVIHLCGKGKLDPTLNHTEGYVQYDYIDKELPDLFALADIIISRAGSNAILKKPNILIPLPSGSSRGDQILNAKAFESAGYSYLLMDEDMNGTSLMNAIKYVKDHRLDYIESMENATESSAVDSICGILDRFGKE